MPLFEPSGDLVTDIQQGIDFSQVIQLDYIDRHGNFTTRAVAPLEVRGDRFYAWDLEQWGLRLFVLTQVQMFFVTEEQFDTDSMQYVSPGEDTGEDEVEFF